MIIVYNFTLKIIIVYAISFETNGKSATLDEEMTMKDFSKRESDW